MTTFGVHTKTGSLINKDNLIGKTILIGGQNDRDHRDGESELTRTDLHPKRYPRGDGTRRGQQGDVLAARRHPNDQESASADLGRDNSAAQGSGESIRVQRIGSGWDNTSDEGRKKTKVVIDTNVFVSATFWAGYPSKVLELIEAGELDLLMSNDVIMEFTEVLACQEIQEKVKDKKLEMRWTLNDIMLMSQSVEPYRRIKIVQDPDDDKIVECAVAGKADFIISQDKHLLRVIGFEGIRIVTPEDFLKHSRNRSGGK